MEDEQLRLMLNDLDEFVECDLAFDALTEFIVDTALVVRAQGDIPVPDSIRSAMRAYRDSASLDSELAPATDPVRIGMGDLRNRDDSDQTDKVRLVMTTQQLIILNNALNEVVNGVMIDDCEFQTRLGVTRDEARTLLAKIQQTLGA